MKTFDDYCAALIGVGEATRELILADAAKHLTALELAELVQITEPDAP